MLWTTKELKKKGLTALNGRFAKSYLAVLICRIFTDIPALLLQRGGFDALLTLKASVHMLIIYVIAAVFLLSVLNAGKHAFFLNLRKGEVKFSALWQFFISGAARYFSVVKGMSLRYLTVSAGLLVFILPGITGYYQTFFMPWILAEHPDMPAKDVYRMSQAMTKGQKINIFIMQLSFSGWVLLSFFLVYRFRLILPESLSPLISTEVYVLPFVYYQAAATELYAKLSAGQI